MKWFKILILTLGLWSQLGTQEAKAQIDTTFWFAAPWVTPDHWWRDPVAFHFSTFSNPSTTIRLYQPSGTYDTTFFVGPNTLFTKFVTHLMWASILESKPADAVLTTGFKVESDAPITVVYDVITRAPQFYNPETYSLKGQNGMGYEFVTPFQTTWNNQNLGGDLDGGGTTQPYQQFSVVATEDNTTIWITPKCDIIGHPADVSFSVVLPQAGNVYTAQNVTQITNVFGQNLAGSVVVSDKPVSVVVSDDSVNPSGGGGCHDLMGDQIVPTDVIGTDYIINKGFLNAGSTESFYVMATENFTTVNIDDGVTTSSVLLNQGDTYSYVINTGAQQLTSVSADKNVYLLHMSGYGCELGEAILPPLNCAGSDTVSFSRANGQSFLLDIVVPTGSEGNFILNGSAALVPAGAFSPVPGTGGLWMGAQIAYNTTDVPIGANLITNSTDLFSVGVINGGPSTGCLYHYLSSFQRKVLVDAGPDTTLCSSTTVVDLVGSVSGGTTTGIWSVLDGSGTLNNPTNLTTTYDPVPSDYTQGYLTFVLESTGNCDPRFDTLKVDFIQSPLVTSGPDDSYCDNNVGAVPISGNLQFALASTWSGGVGGSFGNVADLNTTYTPSPTDIANDSVALYLTSSGSFFSCPDDEDTLVIYFTPAPTVMAGPDQVVCGTDPDAALSGLVSGPTTTGEWSTSGSGSFSPSEFNLTTDYLITSADTAAGSVTLVLTSTANGNCLAVSDSLVVTILDKPIVTILTDDSLCANVPSLPLDGMVTTGFSTVWSVNGTGGIGDVNSLNTTYTVQTADTSAGSIWIYLETIPGICPVETDSLEIEFVAPPVVFAGLDQAFCANEPISLAGTLAGTASGASWTSLGTGAFNPGPNLLNTFYFPSALDLSNGSVQLILTSTAEFGCLADDDTLNVTYKPQPTAAFVGTPGICFPDNMPFFDQSTTTDGTINSWSYDFGVGGTSIAADPVINFSVPGPHLVTLIAGSTNGCYDTVQHVITINPQPTAGFTNTFACENEETDFIDVSTPQDGTIDTWAWDFNNGASSSSIQNPAYGFGVSGTYPVMLTVTTDSLCVGTITQNVDVLAGPNAAFTVTPVPALALEQVFFNDQTNDPGVVAWYWDFGDGNGGFNQNEVYSYSAGGYYDVILTVTDTAGCQDTAMKELQIILEPALPTAFTPNNDGENDFFIIRGGPFTAVDFKIFNNWGQLVYSTTDVNHLGWDGTFDGQDAPIGVYTWTYTVLMPGDNEFIEEGDVTLMR